MNRRTFLALTATAAAATQTRCFAAPTSASTTANKLMLGASQASLLNVREIETTNLSILSQNIRKFQVVKDGDTELALIPEGFETNSVSQTKTQFILAQLLFDVGGKVVVRTPYSQTPEIPGSSDAPDIAVKTLTLESFHIDQRIDVSEKTKGFLRVTVGNKADNGADVLSWAITTAVDLYNQSQIKGADKSKLNQHGRYFQARSV